MRETCRIDVLVSAKDKHLPALVVAARLFEKFRGCRILAATIDGPRLETTLLLPEVLGNYELSWLQAFISAGLSGRGAVLVAVHSLREATAVEVLDRTLSKRNGARAPY